MTGLTTWFSVDVASESQKELLRGVSLPRGLSDLEGQPKVRVLWGGHKPTSGHARVAGGDGRL